MKTIKIKDLSEEEFYEEFKPDINHIDDNASFGGCMFETYGQELDYVFKMSKRNRVVTITEDDSEEREETFISSNGVEAKEMVAIANLYYSSGFHYVNRLGFLVLDKPYKYEFEVKID
ncbi:MAG: hypothetical protein SGJ10_12855 [Bacteroidota bacterium]|nr:hypothetical protein [Bacteroidota bacterium]